MYPLPSSYHGDPTWASGSLLVLLDTARPVKFWDAPGHRALGEVSLRIPAGARPTLGWPVYCSDDRGKSTVHCISADGRWAVGDGCAWDLGPCVDALSAGAPLAEPRPILLPGEEGEIWYPATLAGEHLLRVREGVGEVWALSSQRLVGRFAVSRPLPWVSLLAGGRVYTSPKDRTLTVTNIATGERLAALEHTQKVHAACLSPDGRFLVTAAGGNVRVWNAGTFEMLHRFKGVGRSFWSTRVLAFHPSGRFFAVCLPDETVRYWTTDGGELARFKWGDCSMTGVGFSPDGMLAAGQSGSVTIWDVDA
jgi:WD40 repeat protein